MQRHLVIGNGEIGASLRNILGCDICDLEGIEGEYDILHICYPFFDGFEQSVWQYKEKHDADLIIIHSTVPVGTSERVMAVHSPVRGIHPHLEESMRTFVKLCGGDRAEEAADILSEFGIPTEAVESSHDTEAGKLWSTTGYGLNIILEKAIHEYCEENELDFDVVYSLFNVTYNEGYADIGKPQFAKYDLDHHRGRVGGHCIEPNLDLLDADLADDLKTYINRYQK